MANYTNGKILIDNKGQHLKSKKHIVYLESIKV